MILIDVILYYPDIPTITKHHKLRYVFNISLSIH